MPALSKSQQKVNLDSLRAANKMRIDSIKAANQARRDSLLQVRKEREKAQKEKEKAKKEKEKAKKELSKKKNKQKELDEFYQEDPKDSIALAREIKSDSLKAARLIETEKRKLAIQAKQNAIQATRKKIIEPLTQEMALGYRWNSDGWSFFVNRGFIKSDNEPPHTSFLFFDFSEKKHPKESRSLNENFTTINPNEAKPTYYKYGKINNFYQLKIGYGNMRHLTGKLDNKSIVINWVYAGGLSMGMLKPYYLDLLVPEGNVYVRKFEKYSDKTKEYFLDLNNQGTIIGGGSFTKGIGELKIQPGLSARSGFYFDYTATRKLFLGVELGASAELYFKEIPIMATAKNSFYFFNLYADFRIGKRWE